MEARLGVLGLVGIRGWGGDVAGAAIVFLVDGDAGLMVGARGDGGLALSAPYGASDRGSAVDAAVQGGPALSGAGEQRPKQSKKQTNFNERSQDRPRPSIRGLGSFGPKVVFRMRRVKGKEKKKGQIYPYWE